MLIPVEVSMFNGHDYQEAFEEARDELTGRPLTRDEVLGKLVRIEWTLWEAIRGAMILTGLASCDDRLRDMARPCNRSLLALQVRRLVRNRAPCEGPTVWSLRCALAARQQQLRSRKVP